MRLHSWLLPALQISVQIADSVRGPSDQSPFLYCHISLIPVSLHPTILGSSADHIILSLFLSLFITSMNKSQRERYRETKAERQHSNRVLTLLSTTSFSQSQVISTHVRTHVPGVLREVGRHEPRTSPHRPSITEHHVSPLYHYLTSAIVFVCLFSTER